MLKSLYDRQVYDMTSDYIYHATIPGRILVQSNQAVVITSHYVLTYSQTDTREWHIFSASMTEKNELRYADASTATCDVVDRYIQMITGPETPPLVEPVGGTGLEWLDDVDLTKCSQNPGLVLDVIKCLLTKQAGLVVLVANGHWHATKNAWIVDFRGVQIGFYFGSDINDTCKVSVAEMVMSASWNEKWEDQIVTFRAMLPKKA